VCDPDQLGTCGTKVSVKELRELMRGNWQVDSIQVFKLPHPVLCIGGVLQVELLGRVQTQAIDQLYYIW
jgi:hypothetical protein